ncbi:hypothetical protein B0T24DRAFT_712360 [Lasiosphaeria ovina]|uniref:Uncharacterized protein n=1 Tax=Lasiosphaeria ovina TaxID=92902 RepID=A0AAE0JVS0_9PEZI|nr:hypothetical protein B0T24DRAFT_712360 [Lasiosphaeria ovina]
MAISNIIGDPELGPQLLFMPPPEDEPMPMPPAPPPGPSMLPVPPPGRPMLPAPRSGPPMLPAPPLGPSMPPPGRPMLPAPRPGPPMLPAPPAGPMPPAGPPRPPPGPPMPPLPWMGMRQDDDLEPMPAMGDRVPPQSAGTSSRSTETTSPSMLATNVLTVVDVKPSEPTAPVKAERELDEEVPVVTEEPVAATSLDYFLYVLLSESD